MRSLKVAWLISSSCGIAEHGSVMMGEMRVQRSPNVYRRATNRCDLLEINNSQFSASGSDQVGGEPVTQRGK